MTEVGLRICVGVALLATTVALAPFGYWESLSSNTLFVVGWANVVEGIVRWAVGKFG